MSAENEKLIVSSLLVMIDQLSDRGIEFTEIVNAVDRQMNIYIKSFATQRASSFPLDDSERAMAMTQGGRIDAIMSYRTRTQCSLMEARVAVDLFMDYEHKRQTAVALD